METTNRIPTPVTFISHDSRDHKIAQEFCRLIRRASGGNLKTFRSSDSSGRSGIEYGSEWYNEIMAELDRSATLIALLTPRSLDRPWIPYEAGIAKGKNTPVIAVALDLTLDDLSNGPFAHLQYCEGTTESLTTLILKLIRNLCHDGADPDEEGVSELVREFLNALGRRATIEKAESRVEDLHPGEDLRDDGYFNLLGPKLRDEFPLIIQGDGNGYDTTGWMLLLGAIRDDLPWLYEIGLDLYRALITGNRPEIERAKNQVIRSVKTVRDNEWLRSILDRKIASLLYNLPDLIEDYLCQLDSKA